MSKSQLRTVYETSRALRRTPIVDDDFAEVRDRCDNALRKMDKLPEMPKVICLCGSTKFKGAFIKANFTLTMEGNIVLSVGWYSHADRDAFYPAPIIKAKLDELHKRKIDLADEILVLNVDGYIGESTRSEIEYAMATGKTVNFMEPCDLAEFRGEK